MKLSARLCLLMLVGLAHNCFADRTVFFVDDHEVLSRPGTKLTPMQPVRNSSNPVIAETKPWEKAIGYCAIHHDSQRGQFQAWYQAYAGSQLSDPTRRVVLCYATSRDGVQWEKPELDLFDFEGTSPTNIVLVGNGSRSVNYGAGVVYDPVTTDRRQRYKLAYWDFVDHDGKQIPGLCVAFSPDGVRWTKQPGPPRLQGEYGVPSPPPFAKDASQLPKHRPAISDVIDVMFDPSRKSFAIYSKTWLDGPNGDRFWKRAVVRSTSTDFINWSEPTLVMSPADDDFGQLHGGPAFFHQGIYFSLVQRLDFGGFDRGGTGNMPSELAISRDGIHWPRRFRDAPFLTVSGDASTFDGGCLWTNATPVMLDEEMRFYYGAYPSWNSDVESNKTGIGFASLPRNRFVAVELTEETGQVTTQTMQMNDASQITINADASQGKVRVELLTQHGYRVAGFTKSDSTAITSDGFEHKVRWGDLQLRDFPEMSFQVRIHLDGDAKLFTLRLY